MREKLASHTKHCCKVPMIKDGVKAIKHFSNKGIKTNCTLVFSPVSTVGSQRCNYITVYCRLDDNCNDGVELVRQIINTYNYYEFRLRFSSINKTFNAYQLHGSRCDVVTCPLMQLWAA